MADCTDALQHTIAQADRVISGRTYPFGTVYWPGSVEGGGGGGISNLPFALISDWFMQPANFPEISPQPGFQLRCIPLIANDISGANGQTSSGSDLFTDSSAMFATGNPNVTEGDTIQILEGADAGSYTVLNIINETTLQLSATMTATDTGLAYLIESSAGSPFTWKPDYANPVAAIPAPIPTLTGHKRFNRFRPYIAGLDRFHPENGITLASQGTFLSVTGNFQDATRPIIPGVHYLQLFNGSQPGIYPILSVNSGTSLTLDVTWALTETDLSWRLSIANERRTPVMLVPYLGNTYAVPLADSCAVRVARSIYSESEAMAHDTEREYGDNQAHNLWRQVGNVPGTDKGYLSCYPIIGHDDVGKDYDDRTIIPVIPWQGRAQLQPGGMFVRTNGTQVFDPDNATNPNLWIHWNSSGSLQSTGWDLILAVGWRIGAQPSPIC